MADQATGRRPCPLLRRPPYLVDLGADHGQSDALNKAIRRARGEWILWLNADDVLASGVLARFVPRLQSTEHALLHGDFGIIDAQGRIVKRYKCSPMTFERLLARGAYVFSASVFVHRNVLIKTGAFDSRLNFCMDYDWLLRLTKANEAGYEAGIVAFLRDHAESKSRTQPWGFWREHRIVRRRHGASRLSMGLVRVVAASHFIVRPFLRSTLWRRIRPAKRLGGRLRSDENEI